MEKQLQVWAHKSVDYSNCRCIRGLRPLSVEKEFKSVFFLLLLCRCLLLFFVCFNEFLF